MREAYLAELNELKNMYGLRTIHRDYNSGNETRFLQDLLELLEGEYSTEVARVIVTSFEGIDVLFEVCDGFSSNDNGELAKYYIDRSIGVTAEMITTAPETDVQNLPIYILVSALIAEITRLSYAEEVE